MRGGGAAGEPSQLGACSNQVVRCKERFLPKTVFLVLKVSRVSLSPSACQPGARTCESCCCCLKRVPGCDDPRDSGGRVGCEARDPRSELPLRVSAGCSCELEAEELESKVTATSLHELG